MVSRKLQTFNFIKHYFAEHGASPSYGEIAAELAISRQRVSRLVAQLVREGLIRRVRGQSRSIELVGPGQRMTVADALLRLQEAGYHVFHEGLMEVEGSAQEPLRLVSGSAGARVLTKRRLLPPAELDHVASSETNRAGKIDGDEAG